MAFDSLKATPFQQTLWTQAGNNGAYWNRALNNLAGPVANQNLFQLLQGQGRVDPRLLAMAQAANSRSTQQQQDAARGRAAAGGYSGGGLSAALQAAIGSAGANRSANLNYQDIADAYQRNQQNLSLYDQLGVQPALGYGSLGVQYGLGQQQNTNQQKAGVLGFVGSLLGGAGKAFGMG